MTGVSCDNGVQQPIRAGEENGEASRKYARGTDAV